MMPTTGPTRKVIATRGEEAVHQHARAEAADDEGRRDQGLGLGRAHRLHIPQDQHRHEMEDQALYADTDQQESPEHQPEMALAQGLGQRETRLCRHLRYHALHRFGLLVPIRPQAHGLRRLPDHQADGQDAHGGHRECHDHVGRPPAVGGDRPLGKQRPDDAADPEASEGHAQCQAAPPVEPHGNHPGKGHVGGAKPKNGEGDVPRVERQEGFCLRRKGRDHRAFHQEAEDDDAPGAEAIDQRADERRRDGDRRRDQEEAREGLGRGPAKLGPEGTQEDGEGRGDDAGQSTGQAQPAGDRDVPAIENFAHCSSIIVWNATDLLPLNC